MKKTAEERSGADRFQYKPRVLADSGIPTKSGKLYWAGYQTRQLFVVFDLL
jgi:hypothetical protein